MSTKAPRRLRIAAVGDLHYRATNHVALGAMFRHAAAHADVLVLCGDLTDHGLGAEARRLAEDLAGLKLPMVGVLGNHDVESGEEAEIVRLLRQVGVHLLDGDPCEIEGVGFAGVKGFCGGFGRSMLEPWGEKVIKQFVQEAVNESMKLESALARLHCERRVVVLHYAPIHDTVNGEPPEIVPYLGSTRLVEPIDAFAVNAALHGHAHFGAPEGRTSGGVPVYNCALPLRQRLSPTKPYVLLEV